MMRRAALRTTETVLHQHVARLTAYKHCAYRAWQAEPEQDLCEMTSKRPSSFWRQHNERQSHKGSIRCERWKSGLEVLYRASTTKAPADNLMKPPQFPISATASDSPHAAQAPAVDLLKADITQDEGEAALKRLNKGTKLLVLMSLGLNRSWMHLIFFLDRLVQTFNPFNKNVPPAWCTGPIEPIFKVGDPEDAGTTRAIAVVVILAKLYAMALESMRLG